MYWQQLLYIVVQSSNVILILIERGFSFTVFVFTLQVSIAAS